MLFSLKSQHDTKKMQQILKTTWSSWWYDEMLNGEHLIIENLQIELIIHSEVEFNVKTIFKA